MLNPKNSCFACGKQNPVGLKLVFSFADGRVKTSARLPSFCEGPVGFAHGGIVSTLLDEAMAQVIQRTLGTPSMAELKVRMKEGVPLEKDIQVEAWIDKQKGKGIFARSQVLSSEGTLLAQGEGKFILVESP